MRAAPGRQGYSLLRGGEEGMSPAELRALPVVIHERRHRRSAPAAEARALLFARPPILARAGRAWQRMSALVAPYSGAACKDRALWSWGHA